MALRATACAASWASTSGSGAAAAVLLCLRARRPNPSAGGWNRLHLQMLHFRVQKVMANGESGSTEPAYAGW